MRTTGFSLKVQKKTRIDGVALRTEVEMLHGRIIVLLLNAKGRMLRYSCFLG